MNTNVQEPRTQHTIDIHYETHEAFPFLGSLYGKCSCDDWKGYKYLAVSAPDVDAQIEAMAAKLQVELPIMQAEAAKHNPEYQPFPFEKLGVWVRSGYDPAK